MAIQWRDSLAIGVEVVDNQHKELFSAIGNLLDACTQGKGKYEVENLMKFLEDYVVKHFTAEEEIQKKYDYPDYKAHKELHEKFIYSFAELKAQFAAEGPSLIFVRNANHVVVDWLVKHIGNIDKALGAYLKDKM